MFILIYVIVVFLQTTHKNLYREVQDHGYVVCVPQSSSLSELQFSSGFVGEHNDDFKLFLKILVLW